MTPGGAFALGLVAGAAAAGGAIFAVGAMSKPGKRASAPPPLPASKGKGYYVLLYNYPPRHRSRRLKGYAGPFGSMAAAKKEAEREKDVWYPSVRKLSSDPHTLGM
jgi:hypothetical protein